MNPFRKAWKYTDTVRQGGTIRVDFFLRYWLQLLIILVLVTLTALGCMAIKKSKSGRAFLAIKDDELAATMMGIKTSRYKILSFVISAFITGVAGGFYSVINNGYIEPTNFVFNISVLIISVVVVGGLGTIRGMFFGAALLQLFPQVFRFLNEWRFVIYGVLLVVMMQFRPQGALGWQSTLPYKLSRRTRAKLKEQGIEPTDAIVVEEKGAQA